MPFSVSSIETQMNEMAELVETGTIRAVGVSNFSRDRMIKAHEALADRGIPLAANQVQFSLVKRGIEFNGILETAKELGVSNVTVFNWCNGRREGCYSVPKYGKA